MSNECLWWLGIEYLACVQLDSSDNVSTEQVDSTQTLRSIIAGESSLQFAPSPALCLKSQEPPTFSTPRGPRGFSIHADSQHAPQLDPPNGRGTKKAEFSNCD
jgi:hypothetical protein